MLDIKFVCNNPDVVKQNIKNKFQDEKLPLVDEVIDLYQKSLKAKQESEALRANRNKLSKQIGVLMGQSKQDPSKKEEAEAVKAQVSAQAEEMKRLTAEAAELTEKVRTILLTIPNIIDPSVPIGPDDSYNVEVQRFGEPVVPDFEVPYHTDIMDKLRRRQTWTAAGRVSGSGFYYLLGDIARLHEAVLAYARDFMIDQWLHLLSSPPS